MIIEEKKIAELESLRQNLKKKAIIVLVIFIIITVVGIVLSLINFLNDDLPFTLFYIGFILIIIGVVGTLLGVNRINIKLINAFKNAFSGDYLKELYGEDYKTFPKQGLSLSYLMQSDVLRNPDRYTSKNLFVSTYKGIGIEGSDYVAEFIHTTTDAKGNTRRVTYSYPGKAYVFTFPRQFNNYFCCFEKDSKTEFYKSPSRKTEVEFESVDFNKKFNSYSSDDTFAFYLMTPQVQLSLLEFDELVDSKIVFVVDQNKLYVFMNSYSTKAKVSVFKKIDEKIVRNYLLELSIPLKLIDDFDVDKNKFLDQNLK